MLSTVATGRTRGARQTARAIGLMLIAIMAAGLLAACDGDDPAPAPDQGAQPLELRRIDQATSYRYRMEIRISTASGDPDGGGDGAGDTWAFSLRSEGQTIVPDREQGRVQMLTPFLNFDREVLRIGDEYWNRPTATAAWEPGSGGSSTLGYVEFGVSPSALFGTDEAGAAAQREVSTYLGSELTGAGTPDTLADGRTALRYSLDSAEMAPILSRIRGPFAGIRGDESSTTVWVDAETRFPLRWDITISGEEPLVRAHVTMDFYDYGASDIVIEPPAEVIDAGR